MNRVGLLAKSGCVMLLLAAAAVVGCAKNRPPDEMGSVSGTINFTQDVRLSPTAVAYVRLADTSDGSIGGKTIVQKELRELTSSPVAFELPFKEKHIDATREYALEIRIVDQGKLMLMSRDKNPVITRGNPSNVEVTMVPARGF
jgi:uncharacterized lipoprotein YbaY